MVPPVNAPPLSFAGRLIAFFHQSSDLYGSDKMLLELADGVQRLGGKAVVLLPDRGPLTVELADRGIEFHTAPMLKLSRSRFTLAGLLGLIREHAAALIAYDRALDGRHVDLVHSNTVAVLGGALWARRHRTPHLWHVHEIVEHPRVVSAALPLLVRALADSVVCNSQATLQWLLKRQPALAGRAVVIWNGIRGPALPLAPVDADLGQRFRPGGATTAVGLLGRINRWKGHGLLMDAADLLWARGLDNFSVAMMGSAPPNQMHFERELHERVERSPIRDRVVIEAFNSDIWPAYAALDIVCVPSTEPEPFGLVAVEAMAMSKPVVASNFGGLAEIVVDGSTGLVFEPKSVEALASAIEKLVRSSELRSQMGAAARRRFEAEFGVDKMNERFACAYERLFAKDKRATSVAAPSNAMDGKASPNLLIIHQSAELYGSDRSLLDFVAEMDRERLNPIVLLPEHGPLEARLRGLGCEVHVTAVLKIGREALRSPLQALAVPMAIVPVLRQVSKLVGGREIALVYTNTIAVLAGALWASWMRVPHVWHVREIILHPKVASFAFRTMIPLLSRQIICNSEQTRRWIVGPRRARSTTVWNGVPDVELGTASEHAIARSRARSQLNLLAEVPVVLMIGRISDWKGQDLLMDAVESLLASGQDNFQLIFAGGGTAGQQHLVDRLKARVAASGLANRILMHPFAEDTRGLYMAADIVVVPSRRPEPFGRVAVEGMAYALPIVAARHGGLIEVVEEGLTGLLVAPNDATALKAGLNALLSDPDQRTRLGRAGRERQRRLFSVRAYAANVQRELLAAAALGS